MALQKVGTSLSNMVMPNIPALIAWGLLTAFFIPDGWTPNAPLESVVGPMIHYLLPLLIANTGGRMIYEARGAVVGVIATMGVIAGSDWLIAQENAAELEQWLAAGNAEADFASLGQVHMFIGAMIMAPLAAWVMKKLDRIWQDHIPAGFEMLVNMFSAGIFGFIALAAGFFGLAPLVNGLMTLLSNGVAALVNAGLLPLVSLLIEPAKVFFLNNAINHGVLTPLGIAQADVDGKSILFLLEAEPRPRRRHPARLHDLRQRRRTRLGPRRRDHPVLRRHPRDLLPLRADEADPHPRRDRRRHDGRRGERPVQHWPEGPRLSRLDPRDLRRGRP